MRKFALLLVILAVLLVAADFGARAYAESRAATAVQQELGTAAEPDVSIEGFPFLVHATQGRYPQVVITATDVDNAALPGIRAVATLSSVALPLRDMINHDTSALTAQATRLQVLVPLASLSAALGQPNLTLSAAPDGSVAVSTTLSIAGQQVPLTGTAAITVAQDTLTIAVKSLSAAGLDVTPVITAAADALVGGLSKSFPLVGLPFTVTSADIAVAGGDVVITATTGPVALDELRAARR